MKATRLQQVARTIVPKEEPQTIASYKSLAKSESGEVADDTMINVDAIIRPDVSGVERDLLLFSPMKRPRAERWLKLRVHSKPDTQHMLMACSLPTRPPEHICFPATESLQTRVTLKTSSTTTRLSRSRTQHCIGRRAPTSTIPSKVEALKGRSTTRRHQMRAKADERPNVRKLVSTLYKELQASIDALAQKRLSMERVEQQCKRVGETLVQNVLDAYCFDVGRLFRTLFGAQQHLLEQYKSMSARGKSTENHTRSELIKSRKHHATREAHVETIRKEMEMKHLKEMDVMKEAYTDTILHLQRELYSQLSLKDSTRSNALPDGFRAIRKSVHSSKDDAISRVQSKLDKVIEENNGLRLEINDLQEQLAQKDRSPPLAASADPAPVESERRKDNSISSHKMMGIGSTFSTTTSGALPRQSILSFPGAHNMTPSPLLLFEPVEAVSLLEPCSLQWLKKHTRNVWQDRIMYEALADADGRLVCGLCEFSHAWFMLSLKDMETESRTEMRHRFYRGIKAWHTDHEIGIFYSCLNEDLPAESISLVCLCLRLLLGSVVIPSPTTDEELEVGASDLSRFVSSMCDIVDPKLSSIVEARWQAATGKTASQSLPLWEALHILLREEKRYREARYEHLQLDFNSALRHQRNSLSEEERQEGLRLENMHAFVASKCTIDLSPLETAQLFRKSCERSGKLSVEFSGLWHSMQEMQLFRRRLRQVPVVLVPAVARIEQNIVEDIDARLRLLRLHNDTTNAAPVSNERWNALMTQSELVMTRARGFLQQSCNNKPSDCRGVGQSCVSAYEKLQLHALNRRAFLLSSDPNRLHLPKLFNRLDSVDRLHATDGIRLALTNNRNEAKQREAARKIGKAWRRAIHRRKERGIEARIPPLLQNYVLPLLSTDLANPICATVRDLDWILGHIRHIYAARMHRRHSNPLSIDTISFPTFVVEFFLSLYGEVQHAIQRLLDFCATLRHFALSRSFASSRLKLFQRLLGVNEDVAASGFVLDVLDVLHNRAVPLAARLFPDTDPGNAAVHCSRIETVLDALTPDRGDADASLKDALSELEALLRASTSSLSMLRIDSCLEAVLDFWHRVRDARAQRFADAFQGLRRKILRQRIQHQSNTIRKPRFQELKALVESVRGDSVESSVMIGMFRELLTNSPEPVGDEEFCDTTNLVALADRYALLSPKIFRKAETAAVPILSNRQKPTLEIEPSVQDTLNEGWSLLSSTWNSEIGFIWKRLNANRERAERTQEIGHIAHVESQCHLLTAIMRTPAPDPELTSKAWSTFHAIIASLRTI